MAKIADDPDIVKGNSKSVPTENILFHVYVLVQHVSLDLSKAIQRARSELGLSQKDLATVWSRFLCVVYALSCISF